LDVSLQIGRSAASQLGLSLTCFSSDVTRVFGDGHIAVFNEIRRQIYEARDGKQPSTAPFPPAPPVNNYPPPLPYGYGPGSPSPYLAGIGIQTMGRQYGGPFALQLHLHLLHMSSSNRRGATVAFKPSPFYEDKSRIGDVKICEGIPNAGPFAIRFATATNKSD